MRKNNEARGIWERRKFREPISAPSDLEVTRSCLRILMRHWPTANRSVLRIAEVIFKVSCRKFQCHPRNVISCAGENSHFSSDRVQPKHCR